MLETHFVSGEDRRLFRKLQAGFPSCFILRVLAVLALDYRAFDDWPYSPDE